MPSTQRKNTSWEHVSHWYDQLIGEHGGYFHQHVIFPQTLQLLKLEKGMRVLDLACGQGAFSRLLAQKGCMVTGIDQSRSLIERASAYPLVKQEVVPPTYIVDDARTLHRVDGQQFDRIVSVLALQNIEPIDTVFTNAQRLLSDSGSFVFVILHPAFRSPRITGWGEDAQRKLQYRRVDRYMTPMEIPIVMHPGKHDSQKTWTYHRPLSLYSHMARRAHLYVDAIEEWTSDKQSVGKAANMENLAREEIPMFMAIRLKKTH